MLNQITPETALYYRFHTTDSSPPPSTISAPQTKLDPDEALKELLRRGCSLATQEWVNNHWCLILWKLTNMLNGGSQPPLRKIVNQDVPAAFPMVLCVSNILWPPADDTEDGVLKLTDRWYRIRAQVDLPMARAVKRGVIKVGRKIGITGARLLTEKKEATEILEAPNSTLLVLSGNSSHLMPWHAKLGFTHGLCISTLHSLTADGGIVVVLDFVIVKAHPNTYLELIVDKDGKKGRIRPRNEAEELRVNEIWKKQHDTEASKLREEQEKKFAQFEGYIDRLERKAGVSCRILEKAIVRFTEDQSILLDHTDGECAIGYPPDHIDSLYDELEYPETAVDLLASTSPTNAAWLSLHTRRQNEKERELISEEIEKELQTICPPCEVRSFRVPIVQDTRTHRKSANRNAQLTIWAGRQPKF
ncbi:BRCA2, oligonucleotide/oligosaccharide-binding, domain 1-domain-containing protein [Pholiota molesta]|nr:BRCA2, oligonucleotide/oligosaccharide-binding, domain 1-domain-containing protein [Pholiota molesta]